MKILLIALLLLPTFSFAQTAKDTTVQARIEWLKANITDVRKSLWISGNELQSYYEQHMLGIGLTAGGTTISTFSILLSKNGNVSPFLYIGTAITITGIITEVFSHRHIKRAGDALDFAGIPTE